MLWSYYFLQLSLRYSLTHINRANNGRRRMVSESKGSKKWRWQILLNLSGREELGQQTDTALWATCEEAIHQRLPATTADFRQSATCLCLIKWLFHWSFTQKWWMCQPLIQQHQHSLSEHSVRVTALPHVVVVGFVFTEMLLTSHCDTWRRLPARRLSAVAGTKPSTAPPDQWAGLTAATKDKGQEGWFTESTGIIGNDELMYTFGIL